MSTAPVPSELADFSTAVTARICRITEGMPELLGPLVRDLARRPGKALRPMLLRGCAGSAAPDPGRLVRLGAVVELVHLASLLHDDVIDRASIRRGRPAAHTVVGSELAMLAGLSCFALAQMEAADVGDGADRLVSEAAAAISHGEVLDVERAFDIRLALPDYLELVERKTGELFRLSCLLGAAEGQAAPDALTAMGAFGRDFGVAFQVLDDCLDLAENGTGKPSGTDHMMGLFGAPTLFALAADTSGELAAMLLSPGFTERDMPAVRNLVTALGGLTAARQVARDRYDRALSALEEAADRRTRDVIVSMARTAWRDPA